MTAFSLHDSIAVLERTPAALQAWLAGLPEGWTTCDEGGGTWSAYDVVGHLIHGERIDWIPRLAIILEHGPTRPFDPFDRFAQARDPRSELASVADSTRRPVQAAESVGKSLLELLAEFALLRQDSVARLRAARLDARHWDLRGTHPTLGEVTLKNLIATWVVHDLGHVAQIARVMARRYGGEVGPWREYLPVLTRPV